MQQPVSSSGASGVSGAAARSTARAGRGWVPYAKVAVFVAAWYPLARLVWFGFSDRLGANPVEFVTRSTGLWTLVFLCIALAVTPLRRLTGFAALLRFRRMLGLYAFFYATLHFLTYVWLDQWFDMSGMIEDIAKRPFITVGFAAFVVLVALAVTSPRAMVRRLGRRWQTLHRAVYAAAVLAILHFWWMKAGKHDLAQPKLYGAIVFVLLTARVAWWFYARARGSRAAAGPRAPS